MDGTAVLIGVLVGACSVGGVLLFILRTRGQAFDQLSAEAKATQELLQQEKVARAQFEVRAAQVEAVQAEVEAARSEVKNLSDRHQDALIEIQRLELLQGSLSKAMETERTSLLEQATERERLLREGLAKERSTLEEQIRKREELIAQAEQQMKDAFESLSSQALKSNRQLFSEQIKETLEQQKELLGKDLDKRQVEFDKLLQPLTESLDEYSKRVDEMDKHQAEKSTKMEEHLKQLFNITTEQSKTAADMKNLFRGPGSRGRIGELMLKRLLDEAGMQEGIHYDLQVSSTAEEVRSRPDCIVKLPSSRRIVIDSKAVWQAYEDSLALDDDTARKAKLIEHAKSVRTTLDQLAKRDYGKDDDIELVIMYIPIEAAFLAAYQADPDLQSYGWNRERKIVLCAPTNLMGLLRIVMLDWRQFETQKNAHEITKMGGEIVDRIRIVADHISDIGRGLNNAVSAYDKAVTSIDRNLLTSAHKLQKMHVGSEVKMKALPDVKQASNEFKKEELRTPLPKARLLELNSTFDLDFEDESSEAEK